MSDCIFCRIAAGEMGSSPVAQGPGWTAVRDINPQAPTHVLVIPSEHVTHLGELTDGGLAGELLLACRQVAEAEGLTDAGYRVVVNTNEDGGQTVPHLHLHLLGGRPMRWPPG